jgi:hypothetical protein
MGIPSSLSVLGGRLTLMAEEQVNTQIPIDYTKKNSVGTLVGQKIIKLYHAIDE